MEQETRETTNRTLPAVALVLAILGVAAVAATRGCLGGRGGEGRFVRPAAPAQVTGPGEPRPAPARALARGEKAPRLVLPDLAGARQDLGAYGGRVVVLNVWASWCAPCVREMPSLQRLHESADSSLAVVTVSVDDDRAAARALVERVGLTAPVWLDKDGERLAGWGTVKFPETWILDREGRVVERVIGEQDWASPEVRDFLARL